MRNPFRSHRKACKEANATRKEALRGISYLLLSTSTQDRGLAFKLAHRVTHETLAVELRK